eukprot:7639173-Karenia_brevis.AAC.1
MSRHDFQTWAKEQSWQYVNPVVPNFVGLLLSPLEALPKFAADFRAALGESCYPSALEVLRTESKGCLLYTSPSPRDTERS